MTILYFAKRNLILTFTPLKNYFFKMSTNTTTSLNITGMRAQYKGKNEIFTEDDLVCKEPIGQFKNWYEEACSCPEILEPHTMCLATCTKSGLPSARFVILRGYSKAGFRFFSYYKSRKGLELMENPNAALVFYWEALRKSVRIEGTVEKLPDKESDEFFYSRSKDFQLGAVFCDQSQPISCKSSLVEKESKFKEKYVNDSSIPRPEDWGGFLLKPHSVEFWQGQSNRLHDRIRFRIPKQNEIVDNVMLHQGEDDWVYERLQP